MVVEATVQLDPRQLADLKRTLRDFPRKVPVVLARSINRSIRTGRTLIDRGIRENVQLKKKDITERVRLRDATPRSPFPAGKIKLLDSGIPLIKFGARQNRRGVTYRVNRGQREFLESAFIKNTRSGRHVLRRKSDPSKASGLVARTPVFIRYGPSVRSLYERTPGLARRVETGIQDAMIKRIGVQVENILRRRSR